MLSLWIASLLKRVQLPWYFFEVSEKRNDTLEQEAVEQNRTIIALTLQKGEFGAEIQALRNEIQYLREELRRSRPGA